MFEHATDVAKCPLCNIAHDLRDPCMVFKKPNLKGDLDGLYGRLPGDLQRLVRRIADAPTYDFAAMDLLDWLKVEWRVDEQLESKLSDESIEIVEIKVEDP